MKKSLIEEIFKSLEAGNEVGYTDVRDLDGRISIHGLEDEAKSALWNWVEARFWLMYDLGYVPNRTDAKFLKRGEQLIMLIESDEWNDEYNDIKVNEDEWMKRIPKTIAEIKNMFSEPIDVDIYNFRGEGRFVFKKGVMDSSKFKFEAHRDYEPLVVNSLKEEGVELNKLVLQTLEENARYPYGDRGEKYLTEVWWTIDENGKWSTGTENWKEEIIEPD